MTKPPMRQEWMVSVLPIDAGTRVLELGFGHGVAASLICDRLDSGRYVGVDRSAKMTKAAEERNAHHVDSGLAEFRNASVDGVSLDVRFDLVLAIHFPPLLRQSGRAEVDFVRRHLEPTGQLWVGIQPLSGSPLQTSIEDIRARLDDNGFEIVDVVEGTPEGRPAAMISGRPYPP